MTDGHKDYSGTPLWKKLGVKQGSRVIVERAPDGFDDALTTIAPLPPEVDFLARATRGIDVALLFTTELRVLERRFGPIQKSLQPAGRLWVAWPKKASNLATDLTFGIVQAFGLDHGMVDNKTASVTEAFQGCLFVYRLRDRPSIP